MRPIYFTQYETNFGLFIPVLVKQTLDCNFIPVIMKQILGYLLYKFFYLNMRICLVIVYNIKESNLLFYEVRIVAIYWVKEFF